MKFIFFFWILALVIFNYVGAPVFMNDILLKDFSSAQAMGAYSATMIAYVLIGVFIASMSKD